MNKALITGITGQDGSYLADLLIAKGYEVHGLVRRSSVDNTARISHIGPEPHASGGRLVLHHCDLTEAEPLCSILYGVQPDEVYHLASQSDVGVSFEMPVHTGDVNGLGTVRLLEATRLTGAKSRIYQASTSEMFGSQPPRQSERTPFQPVSPYGAAKLYAYWMSVNYRQSHDLFVANGILFNHESERRGENFLSRKVTKAVARIHAGLQEKLHLGNMEALRDWGYAPEYVQAMWSMLQYHRPDDFVIGTGEAHSVREFVALAFAHVGLDWQDHVVVDPALYRPRDVKHLQANPEKASKYLKWEPQVRFGDLVGTMVDADLAALAVPPSR